MAGLGLFARPLGNNYCQYSSTV